MDEQFVRQSIFVPLGVRVLVHMSSRRPTCKAWQQGNALLTQVTGSRPGQLAVNSSIRTVCETHDKR